MIKKDARFRLDVTARDCPRHETVPRRWPQVRDFADHVDSRQWPFKATTFGGRTENNVGQIALFYSEDSGARDVVDGRRLPSASVPQLSTVSIEHRGRGGARRAIDCKTRRSKNLRRDCRRRSPARTRHSRGQHGIRRDPADPRGARYKSSSTHPCIIEALYTYQAGH